MNFFRLLAIGLIITSCGKENNDSTQQKPALSQNTVMLTDSQSKTFSINTNLPENRKISKVIKVTGKVDVSPQKLVSISVPLGGYLKSISLFPGAHVKKGEIIATLEDVQYIQLQQDYLITKAKLELADAEYKRQKGLNENKASSDKILQQAKAEYQSLRITLYALAEKLRLLQINPQSLDEQNISRSIVLRAPFNALVSKVSVNAGKYVSPSDILFELIDPNDIHLNINVFEKDLLQISAGQKLIAYSNSNPNKKYSCKIMLINRSISSDQTAEVHALFDSYSEDLVPGMYMNADILLQDKDAYVVPERAVVSFESKNYVFVEKQKLTFEMTEVTTGETENGWIEITNPQMTSKKIVWEGAYTLLMTLKNTTPEE